MFNNNERDWKVTARGWEDRKWGVRCGGVGVGWEVELKERIASRAKASLGLREDQSLASSDARYIFKIRLCQFGVY